MCTNIDAALSVVKFLQDKHADGFVHGDIRGVTIVFSDKGEGWLIDFGFGGKVDETLVFPDKYNKMLEDGRRDGCDGGTPITKEKDVLALRYVLFFLHRAAVGADTNFRLAMYDGLDQTTVAGFQTTLEQLKCPIEPSDSYKRTVKKEFA